MIEPFNDFLLKIGIMTKEEIIKKINSIVSNSQEFEIGKTGLNPDERLEQGDYREEYNYIEGICWSANSDEIDALEIELIQHYKNDNRFNLKCDNEQEGGGEMTQSDKYWIYVVYN